jgi:hypothetical protein
MRSALFWGIITPGGIIIPEERRSLLDNGPDVPKYAGD